LNDTSNIFTSPSQYCKWRWGRFSQRTSVSPANLHSICFSIIIFTITRGWHNRSGAAAVPIASQPPPPKVNIVHLHSVLVYIIVKITTKDYYVFFGLRQSFSILNKTKLSENGSSFFRRWLGGKLPLC
jgi:hypothetical protein